MTTAGTLRRLAMTGGLAWFAAFGAATAADPAPDTVAGDRHSITVIDGDTLQIGGRIVQLHGIDAPELGQLCLHDGRTWHCGLDAAYDLRKMIQLSAGAIRCLPAGPPAPKATREPPAMACLDGGQDISNQLVERGIAVALPDADFAMRRTESLARRAGLGLWQSDFVSPWEWRAGKRLVDTKLESATVCVIKGATGKKGRKRYFTPLDPDYDAIPVGGPNGAMLFCSDEQARAAGYRRPGQTAP